MPKLTLTPPPVNKHLITLTVTCPACGTVTPVAAFEHDLMWDTCDGCGRMLKVTVTGGEVESVE